MENVRKAIVRMVKGLKSFLTELDIQVNLKMTEEMDREHIHIQTEAVTRVNGVII